MTTKPATAKKPTDRKKPLTAAQRRARENSSGEYYAGEVNGQYFRVSHPQTWRASSIEAIRQGDILGWAAKAVHPDDFEAFKEADPNGIELAQLIEEASEYFGSDLGE